MKSLNKTAAAVAGSAILVFALMSTMVGGAVKAYLPARLGYSGLGWVHAGSQARFGFNLPKWAGMEGFLSVAQMPLRHHLVYMKQGQTIVADYDVQVWRGGMRILVYRSDLLGLRGDTVKSTGFGRGTHTGTLEFTAPEDGLYRFRYRVFPFEYPDGEDGVRPGRMSVPLRNFEVVYDIRWRLERN